LMVYFTTPLVSQIRYRQKVDMMNNELEKFGRILSWRIRGTIPIFVWRYWGKQRKSSVRIAGVPVGFRTQLLW
jgi:hypothetical protein